MALIQIGPTPTRRSLLPLVSIMRCPAGMLGGSSVVISGAIRPLMWVVSYPTYNPT